MTVSKGWLSTSARAKRHYYDNPGLSICGNGFLTKLQTTSVDDDFENPKNCQMCLKILNKRKMDEEDART